MKVRLLRDVRDISGRVFREGEVLEAYLASDGVVTISEAQYLPLNFWEYELEITPEDFSA